MLGTAPEDAHELLEGFLVADQVPQGDQVFLAPIGQFSDSIRTHSVTSRYRSMGGGTPPNPPKFSCFMAVLLPNFFRETFFNASFANKSLHLAPLLALQQPSLLLLSPHISHAGAEKTHIITRKSVYVSPSLHL